MKSKRMVPVTIKVPLAFRQKAERIAEKNEWTISQVFRKSIAKDFLRHMKKFA